MRVQCRFLFFFSALKGARSLANKRDRFSYLAGPKPLGKDRKMQEREDKDKEEDEKGKTEELAN